MLLVDAHEDIAPNMLAFGREYRESAYLIRQRERKAQHIQTVGSTLLGKKEWLQGEVALIFATLFAAPARQSAGWDRIAYSTQQEAYHLARHQLDAYYRLVDEDAQFRFVTDRESLHSVLHTWADGSPENERVIGLLLLMEGADPILEPEQAQDWIEWGVRIIGPAWMATRYAGGMNEPGPLTRDGMKLLDVMEEQRAILDLSHLAERACYQALDRYEGAIVATHANPQRFLPTDRGLSDKQIARIAERNGVIGVMLYNPFLHPEWRRGDRKEDMALETVAHVIDHVCQVTGSVDHVGIGSDFDGGFGWEDVPAEIDTVADLQKLAIPLAGHGYTPEHIVQIFSGNWLRVLHNALPTEK